MLIKRKGAMNMLLDAAQHDTIFYSQYFCFYVFGALILLYLAAVLYLRIKRPKKGIKDINVRIEALNRIRVQIAPRNTGNDELKSNLAQPPASKFDVTFTDEEMSEAYVFSMSEKQCDGMKIGDKGMLRFNGDEFISFKKYGEA